MNKANYVATKSAWAGVTFLKVLFFWLIIPLILMICNIISAKSEKIYFYDDKIIVKKGVISKSEQQFAFKGVIGVSVKQSLWGRMFNYGEVFIDVPGRWNVDTSKISKPNELKKFLETKLIEASTTALVG